MNSNCEKEAELKEADTAFLPEASTSANKTSIGHVLANLINTTQVVFSKLSSHRLLSKDSRAIARLNEVCIPTVQSQVPLTNVLNFVVKEKLNLQAKYSFHNPLPQIYQKLSLLPNINVY